MEKHKIYTPHTLRNVKDTLLTPRRIKLSFTLSTCKTHTHTHTLIITHLRVIKYEGCTSSEVGYNFTSLIHIIILNETKTSRKFWQMVPCDVECNDAMHIEPLQTSTTVIEAEDKWPSLQNSSSSQVSDSPHQNLRSNSPATRQSYTFWIPWCTAPLARGWKLTLQMQNGCLCVGTNQLRVDTH